MKCIESVSRWTAEHAQLCVLDLILQQFRMTIIIHNYSFELFHSVVPFLVFIAPEHQHAVL